MRIYFAAAIGAGLLTLGGCVIIDGEIATDFDRGRHIDFEPVYAADIARDGITLRVASNGCTEKVFFKPHTRVRDEIYEVGFERVREDYCKASVPEGVALNWSYSELGFPGETAVAVRNTVGRPE